MEIKKLILAGVLPFALFGCPEKPEAKADPATTAAKDAGSVVRATGAATPAPSAKAGGGW
jgi:hypothetical protein